MVYQAPNRTSASHREHAQAILSGFRMEKPFLEAEKMGDDVLMVSQGSQSHVDNYSLARSCVWLMGIHSNEPSVQWLPRMPL
jgi:hypothetical protein